MERGQSRSSLMVCPGTSSMQYLFERFFLSKFTDTCKLVDDTIFSSCDMDLNTFIKRLDHDSLLGYSVV